MFESEKEWSHDAAMAWGLGEHIPVYNTLGRGLGAAVLPPSRIRAWPEARIEILIKQSSFQSCPLHERNTRKTLPLVQGHGKATCHLPRSPGGEIKVSCKKLKS